MAKPVGLFSYFQALTPCVRKHPVASITGVLFTALFAGIYSAVRQFPFRDIRSQPFTTKASYIAKNFFGGLTNFDIEVLLRLLAIQNSQAQTTLTFGDRTYEFSAQLSVDPTTDFITFDGNNRLTFSLHNDNVHKLAKIALQQYPKSSQFKIVYRLLHPSRPIILTSLLEILHRREQLQNASDATLRRTTISILVEIAKSGKGALFLHDLGKLLNPQLLRSYVTPPAQSH